MKEEEKEEQYLFVELWGNGAMAISYVLQNVTIVKPSSAPVKLLKVEQNCSLQYLQKLVKNCTTVLPLQISNKIESNSLQMCFIEEGSQQTVKL